MFPAPTGQEHLSPDQAEMIEEKDTVEMIDLVLDRPSLEAGRLLAVPIAIEVERLDHDTLGPGHIAVDIRYGEAALLGGRTALGLDDGGVDHGKPIAVGIDHRHPAGHANLIRGQTVSFAVNLASSDGFSQLAALSLTGLPAGVTAVFKPTQITAGQTSVLTLTAPAAQPTGAAALAVTASATVDGQAVSPSTSVQVTVQAPTTSFVARTVLDDARETPLAGVSVAMLGKNASGGATGCTGSAVSDAAGNVTLSNLPATCVGPQLIGFDGTTVTTPPGEYSGVNLAFTLVSGQVTASPVLVHLPRTDDKETFLIQQNAPTDQTYSFARIPGLSVTVYAGTTLTLPNGSQPNPFPLAAAPVAVDRLPDAKPPVPTMLGVFFVSFSPANTRASKAVAVYYPNTLNTAPGTNMALMTLDPTRGSMVPYGTGTVGSNGAQIIPDLDPAFPGRRYGLVNFDWHAPMPPPPPTVNPCPQSNSVPGSAPGDPPATCGKPIDLASGLEVIKAIDIGIRGSRGPVAIERTYRTLSQVVGPFGIGSGHNYDYRLDTGTPQGSAAVSLIMPDGNRFTFSRQSDGRLANMTVPAFRGAGMTTNVNATAEIRWKDGSIYRFAPGNAGQSVLARARRAHAARAAATANINE